MDPTQPEDAVSRIIRFMAEQNLAPSDVYHRDTLSKGTLTAILSRRMPLTVPLAIKIADALAIPVRTLLGLK